LIELKIVTGPSQEGYEIEWPDLSTPSDKDKAEVGKIRSETIKNYASTLDAEFFVPFEQFLLELLDMDPERVARIIDARDKQNKGLIDDDGRAIRGELSDDDLIDDELDEGNEE